MNETQQQVAHAAKMDELLKERDFVCPNEGEILFLFSHLSRHGVLEGADRLVCDTLLDSN